MSRLTLLLLAALAVTSTTAQTCPPNALVWLLLDMSELAKLGSSTSYNGPADQTYDILANQIRNYASSLANDNVDIGIISYTGNLPFPRVNARVTLTPKPAREVASLIGNQHNSFPMTLLIPDGTITQNGRSTGASKTINGLKLALTQTAYKNVSMVVVISAQGSTYNSDVQTIAAALRAKFSGLYVVRVQRDNTISDQELRSIAGSPAMYKPISSYSILSQTLQVNLTPRLQYCSPTVTLRPPPFPPANNPCANCKFFTGTYNVGHPDTCSKFYVCTQPDPNTVGVNPYPFKIFNCGPGTLFSDVTRTCVSPGNYSCSAWGGKCQANSQTEKYAHLCCTKYWECGPTGNVTARDCPANTIFSGGDCVPNTYPTVANSYKAKCFADENCLAGPDKGCQFHRPIPGNPCVYDHFGTEMPCVAGFAWNQTECSCSTLNPICNAPLGVDQIDGTVGTGVCRAYMSLSFSQKSWATDEVANVPNKYFVEYGETVHIQAASFAEFTGQPGKTRDLVFLPFYAHRPFPVNFAMEMKFRLNPVSTSNSQPEIILVANDRCGDCSPTLRLTANRNGFGSTWDIKFWVIPTGVPATPVTVTVPGVNVASQSSGLQAWSRVEVRVQGSQVTLTVINPSQPPRSNTATLPPLARVKHNICGLSLAQGRLMGSKQLVAMQGAIDEFKFYECSNFRTLV